MHTLSLITQRLSILLLLSLMFMGADRLGAAPFKKQIEFTQPGGATIQLHGEGDEFYAVFETLDGYTVVFDETVKGYCYATLSSDARDLVSTGVPVEAGTGASLGLTQHLRMSKEAIREQVAARYAQWDDAMEVSKRWNERKAAVAAGLQPSPPNNPTIGVKVGLTLLIDFDDEVGKVPQAEIVEFLNGDNYTAYGNNGSVKSLFYYNSNGKLTYSNVVTVYVRAPKPKTVYNDTSKDAGLQGRLLINDVLAVLKELPNYDSEILPQFDALTTDSQNNVVAFNVFYAGDNGGRWSYGLWPHSWSLASPVPLSTGGKRIMKYQITDISNRLEIGTFAHENGHMLCGFPDLYDYTNESNGSGDWCLMAFGSSPGTNPSQVCAYLKRAAGWATTIDLDSNSSLVATVSSQPGSYFNTFYRYAKPGTPREYFIIECRSKTNYDAALPGAGIAIWHIDEDGSNNKANTSPNTTHNNFEATLVQADGKWQLERGINYGDPQDLYYKGNSTVGYSNVLSDVSWPHAHWWNGQPSGLILRAFSAIGRTMTFVVGPADPAPSFTYHPGNVTAVPGQTVSLSCVAGGIPLLKYQWRKDGLPVTGATTASLTISNVQISHAGAYSVALTNDYGWAMSGNGILTILPTVPLPLALNNTNQTWTVDWSVPWFGQTEVARDQAAARSYFITNGQSSSLETTVTGPGTLSFWWKVSSQPNSDYLSFRYGAVQAGNISGEVDWQQKTFYLPPGRHGLNWTYSKDAAGTQGQDRAWVDQVTYTAGSTSPFVVSQPADQRSVGGSTASFQVVADGTPPLAYQWLANGVEIAGATGSVYTISAPKNTDTGLYAVRITNTYGATLSANAALAVMPMAIAGDNTFGQLTIPSQATNAIALSAGAWHTLALTPSGQVLAWGNNWNGQCSVPAGLSRVIAIAAGGYHNVALKQDGTVACWGANDSRQASPPAGLNRVIAIAAGSSHSLALRADGVVLAWGDNSWGQSTVPAGLGDVVAIAAGGNHNLALRSDGTVAAWGENHNGQGAYAGQSTVPPGLAGVTAIAAGEYHSLAVKADGTVVAWGDNSQNQCHLPSGLAQVKAVCGGGSHSVALTTSGTVLAWGANWNKQCEGVIGVVNITAVAAGSAHTLVLLDGPQVTPRLFQPERQGSLLLLRTETSSGKRCALEYKNSLADTNWTTLPAILGNGAPQFLVDRKATSPARFYRVRQW